MNTRKELLLRTYRDATTFLGEILDGIPAEQLHWKPQPEARPISGMMRHLIRVDSLFLKILGLEPASADPGPDADAQTILATHRTLNGQFVAFIESQSDEDLLGTIVQREGHDEPVLMLVHHIAQHYLYHGAQMLYLRRALDRNWTAPTHRWSETVDGISSDALSLS